MKFAIAAFLGLVSVQAVTLSKMSLAQTKHMEQPTPDELWEMCNTDAADAKKEFLTK